MLATFVIGLREGLEAALIVGIIAAFLRKNGRSLVPMWIGIGAGVLISVAVGVTLKLVESSLDQQAQEGMESVIGAIAVVFVTGMILWMATHARGMKRELETSAQAALGEGSSRALVLMAFLAVLKEGFETAVFLLATFQASTNATLAATGALLGVVVSAGIGYGLYTGGVRINLAKFFKGTSVFLVLVAAGLVVNALRTAHEAGWLNAGQQRTVDLSWLAPVGSVQAAVVTGVLGIPADPRVVEVIGWFAYLVPLSLVLFWPQARRLSTRQGTRLKLGLGALFVVAAAALALAVPAPHVTAPDTVPLVDAAGSQVGAARLAGATVTTTVGSQVDTLSLTGAEEVERDGITALHVTRTVPADTSALPTTLTASQLVAINGGRAPVGIDPRRYPGPYAASWSRTGSREVWVAEGVVLDATARDAVALTLTAGGLTTPRTVSITSGTALPDGSTPVTWSVSRDYVTAVETSIGGLVSAHDEADLLRRVLPLALGIAGILLLLNAARALRRERSAPGDAVVPASPVPTPAGPASPVPAADRRSTIDAR